VKAWEWFVRSGDPSGIRTGDAYQMAMAHGELGAIKTNYPMLESTQYQGQEAVPTEVLAKIVEKRDPISVVRAAGAMADPVGSNAVVLPIEKNSAQKFGITTIDGTNTFTTQTSQPIDKLSGTVYLFTYNVPIDMQLIEDSVFPVEAWLNRRVGRGWGLTENQYFLVGSGSGEPQGAVVGGTAAFTTASGLTVAATEVVRVYHALPAEYRDTPVWVMRGATEGTIRGLTGNPFYFVGNGGMQGGAGNQSFPQGAGWLVDQRSKVFNSDEMAAIGVNAKPVLVGNFAAGYQIFERKTLTVLRDPYSQANKGLINLWFYFRETGGVVNSTAFQYILEASA
jgi:HK97 family phage major capsid protein